LKFLRSLYVAMQVISGKFLTSDHSVSLYRILPHLRTLPPTLPPYLRLPLLQQHARSGFSFYRGREEAVHYDRLRRLIVEFSCGR
jgi:hypothetical protein